MRRRWLRRRRGRSRDLLASVVAEGRRVAEGGGGRKGGGSHHCRCGYCWVVWVGGAGHLLKERRGNELVECQLIPVKFSIGTFENQLVFTLYK